MKKIREQATIEYPKAFHEATSVPCRMALASQLSLHDLNLEVIMQPLGRKESTEYYHPLD
jgi:hypothetical protein